ncbi:dTDP-4-dehydrorhamnose 3,5-epimerase [Shewanella sp. Scap07]|uniref:dTDP-4-dehydrorhamnose 3,5-epimerase n=1 Tax=Shewanella sp. Scap07 TaxID=2589987 RepID=UPI0015B8F27D|nr:dTDP-4-dehydrorhamnose 3,5-epimerase [Shewanella sp. Scap07]QLE86066.1 dTDP-4-dehydrorhamnose 3,5-epimerase [Shewanella sp. Scap07]
MNFISTEIEDVKLIEPIVHSDERGYFMEVFDESEFRQQCGNYIFIRENQSLSSQNVLRGLHYQTQHTQGKLIRVVRGQVFDVAVDIRDGSPTYGQWVGHILSEVNKLQLWVPPGFAHGFYVMSSLAEVVYKCTDKYDPSSEVSISWKDPEIAIKWPFSDDHEPILSVRDSNAQSFADAKKLFL